MKNCPLRQLATILIIAILGMGRTAFADITIEINQGIKRGLPIAILPFVWGDGITDGEQLHGIIAADLNRSGRFASLSEEDFIDIPTYDEDINFYHWQLLKSEALVFGRVERAAESDGLIVSFKLYDVYQEKLLINKRYQATDKQLRKVAHNISNEIFAKLTGIRGDFDTKIAYVNKLTSKKQSFWQLVIADVDGYNHRTVLKTTKPILSPAWSPDGQKIAYAVFRNKKPAIYIQELRTGKRELIVSGLARNSAPAWSPDGKRLAYTSSKDDIAENYIIDLGSRKIQRLTFSPGIDTEPAWSPDGRHIAFTSNRSGSAQLYQMRVDGLEIQRLSFAGNYNVSPNYTPDGQAVLLLTRTGSGFQIGRISLDNRRQDVVSIDDRLVESPSISPNGVMIVYIASEKGSNIISTVSSDGQARDEILAIKGKPLEVCWSPFLH